MFSGFAYITRQMLVRRLIACIFRYYTFNAKKLARGLPDVFSDVMLFQERVRLGLLQFKLHPIQRRAEAVNISLNFYPRLASKVIKHHTADELVSNRDFPFM